MCPDWAFDCSHYSGIKGQRESHRLNYNAQLVLDSLRPEICSYNWTIRCPFSIMKHVFQVQLFDDTVWPVDSLHLTFEDFNLGDVRCEGARYAEYNQSLNGSVTGTPDFCKISKCDANASTFCWLPHGQRVYLNSPAGRVIIRAWGAENKVVFVANHTESNHFKPEEVNINCHEHGAELSSNQHFSKLEACIDNHCVFFAGNVSMPFNVSFPLEYLEQDYVVTATIWKNDHKVYEADQFCNAVDFCRQHRCLLCYKLIECSSEATVIVLISACFVIIATAVFALAWLVIYLTHNARLS